MHGVDDDAAQAGPSRASPPQDRTPRCGSAWPAGRRCKRLARPADPRPASAAAAGRDTGAGAPALPCRRDLPPRLFRRGPPYTPCSRHRDCCRRYLPGARAVRPSELSSGSPSTCWSSASTSTVCSSPSCGSPSAISSCSAVMPSASSASPPSTFSSPGASPSSSSSLSSSDWSGVSPSSSAMSRSGDQIAGGAGKGFLVVGDVGEPGKVVTGFLFHPRGATYRPSHVPSQGVRRLSAVRVRAC